MGEGEAWVICMDFVIVYSLKKVTRFFLKFQLVELRK